MNNKITETIKKIAKANNINIDLNNKKTNLKELGIDSLKLMNLVFKIEEELGVVIEDHKLVLIKTLEDLENTLAETLSE